MTNNVISIFKKKEESQSVPEEIAQEEQSSLKDLEETMKKNKALKEQREKERLKTNQSVLKSYKIKKN